MSPAPHHRLARIARRWRALIFVALAAIAVKPLLDRAGDMNTFRDAQVLAHYEDAARLAVTRFGQVPLWDPWYCGGLYNLGSPQARFASPTFLFTLLFGTFRGEALAVFAMLALGLEGTFRYLRARGASSASALLVAPAFALSASFATAPAMGWINFMGFELLPWALFGLRRAIQGKPWGIALSAGALAWMVGMGGTYTAPIAAIFCALDAAWDVAVSRRRPRALLFAGVTALLALALAAVRLWPVLETLAMAPRMIGGGPGNPGPKILKMLVMPLEAGQGAGDFAGGTFHIGAPLVVPLLASIYLRRRTSTLVFAFLAFWLATGYAAAPSLFHALRQLPLYASLRYPERFLIPFALLVAVLAANGLTALQRWRWAWWITAVLLVLDAGVLIHNHHFAALARSLTPAPVEIDQPFHQARGNRWAVAQFAPMNRGSLSCWEAYPVPQSPLLRGDLHEEVYSSAGEVKLARFSPNELVLDASMLAPGRVRLNQNWHPGWRADRGNVVNDAGLLALDLPAGEQTAVLVFRPRSGIGGALVSALALLATLVIARWGRWWAVALPWAALAVVAIAWSEPGHERRLLTPRGESVVAEAPPPGSMAVGARLQHGVELVAVTVSNAHPSAGETVLLELDWRTSGAVPEGTGIFVHVESDDPDPKKRRDDHIGADHVGVSGVLELDRAPANKILRDQIELTIPHTLSGRTLTVHAGLWIIRGRGERLRVEDPGALSASEDRLLITTLHVP